MTLEMAMHSLCVHLMVFPTPREPLPMGGIPAELLEIFATAIQADAILFEQAGDLETARAVRDYADDLLSERQAPPEMGVFLAEDVSAADRSRIERILKGLPGVESFKYESKEDAYQRFLDLFDGNPDLVKEVSPGDVPASFRVRLTPTADPTLVTDRVERLPGVVGVEGVPALGRFIPPPENLAASCDLALFLPGE